MAKQLNKTINLAFTADTSDAVAALNKLKKSLGDLSRGYSMKKSDISQITPEIQKGIQAAADLKAKLESATNVNTGKLDLGRFSDSLKKSGMSLQQYATQLNALGPQGRQAFTSLTQSIMQAEAPLVRCNAKLKEFGVSLANTARWQISSSILHGFMGAVSSAYRYAQDLNESLNDIRIVTGYNVDTMEKFAASANKAARNLSTTTNEYVKASLIFFQQGDNEAEAMQKANVVTKMANVTGQSSETVSSQLTAIWNNFNKAGDQSYEHYADVLTKLGAATASSTDEIAGGLEKFAGIADTIGLSYDYAASALATITATSRESEEVVGTALKTIFARMQGLKLGETLEDGTTLNKYSEALKIAGVNLFDSNKELKTMDTLLSEVASKWDTLSKDNQMALAQGVAGIRQYNQFITLMDNWDFMEDNLDTARAATGELSKQSEIYEESWKAASKRVSAAAENLYTKIIDDDFFIDLLNGFAKVVDGVGGVVDAFGGLKGILLTVGAFATRIFQKEIAEALRNTAYNIKQFIPGMGAKQDDMRTKSEALTAMKSLQSNETGAVAEAENNALAREFIMQTKLQSIAKDLSAEQLKQLQLQMDTVRVMDQRAIAATKAAEAAKEEAQELEEMTKVYAKLEASEKARKQHKAEQDKAKAVEDNARQRGELKGAEKLMQKAVGAFKGDSKSEFLMTQYEQAEQSVQQDIKTNNLELSDDEIQSRIYQAFVDGIRSAAQDSSDTTIQQFAQEYENALTEAGNAAVQQLDQPLQMSLDEAIAQANQKAERVVADLKQGVDAATGSQVRARDLAKTAASMTTVDENGVTKQPKQLAQLHEVLTRKIAATKKEAVALQEALGDKRDTGLDDVVVQLTSMEKELEDAENDATKLNAVLQQLQAFDGAKGTVTDQLSEAAGYLGREMAVGYFNDSGEGSYSEEFFQTSKKSKLAEVKSENADADVANFGDSLNESFEKSGQRTADWATGITNATNIVMGLGSAITSVQGAVDVFTNPDASNWDKFSAVMSVLIGLLPVLSTLFTATGVAGTAAGAGITAAMGPVGWIIMAIVAVVAALTAAFIALSNAYNKDAINAKKAAENAEKLAEASQKAKEAVQGIKDGFDAYDTAVEKLNDCVRGTTEWNEALKSVNDTVLGLLQTYPDLLLQKDLFARNEFGMLEINEDKRDDVMEQVERGAMAAQAAELVAQAHAASAGVTAQETQTQRDIQAYTKYTTVYSGSSLVDNGNYKKLADLDPEEFKDKLREIYEQPADMTDEIYEDMINHFSQYQSEIDKLADAAEDAATQMDNAAFLIANAKLGEEYGNFEVAAAGEQYEKQQKEIYDKIIAQDRQENTKATDTSDAAEEIWKRFQDATGTNFKLADNAVQGNDDHRVYAYIDNTGKEQTYTIEYIAETIAAAEAIKGLADSAAHAQEILNGLGEKGTGFAAALSEGTDVATMADYLSGMTQSELDAFAKQFERKEDGSLGLTEEGYTMLGVTADQFAELAKVFGISVETLTQNLFTARSDVGQSLTTAEKQFFANWQIDTSNMTIGQQKEFAQNKDTINANAKAAGLSSLTMNSILAENSDIDPLQLNEFMSGLSGVSLKSEDAAEQIRDLAEKYNIQGASITSLIGDVENLDRAYNVDTKNIAEQSKELKEIIGDGLETGDIISEEDITKLKNAGVDVNQYFTQMSDGTYSLTGKAKEFNAAVNNITLTALKDQVKDFNVNAFKQAIDNGKYREGYIAEHLRDTSVALVSDTDSNGVMVGTDAADLGAARLDYLSSFDVGTFNFTEEQKQLMSAYQADPNKQFTNDELKMIADMMDVANTKAAELESQMFSTVTSVNQLKQVADEVGQYSLAAYGEGLINLASQYDNCDTEVVELQKAMMSGDETLIKTKMDALELATTIGELSSKYGLDAEDVETHAKLIQSTAKDYKLTAQQAANLAVANRRMNKGVQTLNSNWKDWSKVLKSSNKNSIDYADTLNDAHEALADLTGAVDASAIPMDFLDASTEAGAEHLEWMSRAAKGDQQAINLLGIALADAQIDAMQFDETMVKMAQDSGLLDKAFDTTKFQTYKDEVLQGITALQDAIKNGTIAAGQNITELMNGNGETWVDSLNAMALATGMSVEEMNGMLNELGVQAKVDVKSIEQDMEVPTYTEVVESGNTIKVAAGINEDGSTKYEEITGIKRYTVPGPPQKVKGWVQVAQISTEEGSIEPPQITYTGTGGGSVGGGVTPSSTSSGKKGGGSKPKKTSEAKKKKSEVVERYKEINDQLDDTQTAMDKASKAADRLYGPKRLKEMEKVNKALQTEIKQLKEKRKEAEQYLKIDQQDLNKAASALNISFTFDNGNISNYEEAMTSVYNQREALLKSFGSTIDEKEQEQLDALDKKIEELKAAIEQYDETRELTEDLDNEIQDAVNEWQDNNYEQLTYKLELQIEINDRDLEVLEYYLSKTEGDFYKQAEGIGYLTQQFGIYNDKLEDNQNHLADLQQEYNDGNISQANYIEGLKEIFSATIADAQALADLDKQMLEYYGNTLDMASEEISKYTDRMEHQTSVLEHFKNIMDIIGESTNYEALGVILEGQAQTIENELKVAQETYDFYSNEAAKKKHLMDRAIASGDMEAAELYRQEWEAAEAAAREAQDNMLSKTEEWAEAMKAVLENELAGLAQTLENALTGGTSFDAITTQMERAASLQEEYLTSTNKIYETNKLINTAQKEIDKTTNTVAKKRLKSFQEETAQLQNKSKLSQYELDIQQAKYELLLAEIALEEAQQAKSTVRLQRDSEGNFGYVYTADANAVADAEQKLADAQNNLYNIGLNGANDYSQKYIQIMQEMHETFSELQQQYLNGEFETEEDYHRAMEDAKAYYFQKLQDYSNLYQVALTTDSRVIADAWSTDFGIMTTKTEDWKKAVNGYLDEVNKAFEGWEEVVERVKTETVGQDLDALEDKTQAIVDVSADLSEQITKEGGVIDSIEAEMNAVSAVTSTYAQWREEIAATIAENEKLMHQTKTILDEQAGGKSSGDGDPKTDNENKSDATTGNSGASGNNNTSSKQPSLVDGSKVTVKKTARHFSRDGGNGTKMQDWVPGYTFTVIDTDGNEVLIGKGNSYSQATGWVRKTDLEGFKTGGYTGSWGSEGKIAMLHEKELILNSDDTSNFLASLEVLREIINVINLHSMNAQLAGLLSTPYYNNNTETQVLEQQVHIEATFPNVSDRNEIEEAFNNLVNRASQFVNRK